MMRQFPSCSEVDVEVWLLGGLGSAPRAAVVWKGRKHTANEQVPFMNQMKAETLSTVLLNAYPQGGVIHLK